MYLLGRYIPHISYVDGNGLYQGKEPSTPEVRFKVYKNNKRRRPDNVGERLIVSALGEFGVESIAVNYCIPYLFECQPQYYKIVVGWYGREYLYRHLADEYWELDESCQWMREYNRAFLHSSKVLAKVEKQLMQHGVYVPASLLGNICVGCYCPKCNHSTATHHKVEVCARCKNPDIFQSMFSQAAQFRPHMKAVPRPGKDALERVKEFVKPNMVGVFARRRVSYGRNLSAEFYTDLIGRLEAMGYNPIWLGEKQSTLPCPLPHITDFSRMPASRELEQTLAIVSQCKFTVQLWTASTRLAAMMGVPYLIVETPDQIIGQGQEGVRLSLVTQSPQHKKMVYCHFREFEADLGAGLDCMSNAIREMEVGNFDDVIGPVEDRATVAAKLVACRLWDQAEES